jgi:hypothetical protein
VEVKASFRGDLEYRRPDQITVVEREDNIRVTFPYLSYPHGMIDILGGKNWEVMGCGKFRNGPEPNVFPGIVLVGENSSDIKSIP